MTLSHTVLSGLAALVAGGSVAILARSELAQNAQDLVAIPWDKLLGVGSGGLAFGVAWYFLQREERMRQSHERVVAENMKHHRDATEHITSTFASTVDKILADGRADADRREERLVELFQKRP